MGKQRPSDSGLPRGRLIDAVEARVADHTHPNLDPTKPHKHRKGLLPHGHDDTGEILLGVDAQFVAANPEPTDDTAVLPATSSAPSVPGGQATADPTPPTTPDESGDASESSEHGAGSGDGGSGRPPANLGNRAAGDAKVTPTPFPDDAVLVAAPPRVTPDATESVLSAAMTVINPADDPGFAIRHAEESARVLIMGQHFANMLKAIAPPYVQLVEEVDARGMWRLLRKIAATHGWDLDNDDEGGGS